MATMIPPRWEDSNDSLAEGKLYERLRVGTPEDWYVVHSVGLTSHRHKTWAEVDFVIVGPFGVLCLEVKGGRITVERGKWFTNGNRLREGPFRQSGGGAAALRGELRHRFPATKRALVEYAVAFPDISFEQHGAGIEGELVYDDHDLERPIHEFVDRVVEFWRARHGWGPEDFRPLSRGERSAIVAWLAPSFDCVPSLRARIADTEAELVRLTESQAKALRMVRSNDRTLIRGGAGTGKTLLAVEEATRLASSGDQVLLCCRSPLLATHLRETVEEDLVEIQDYESLLWNLVRLAGTEADLPDVDEADLLSIFLPEKAAEGIIDQDIAGSYDALVLDEAQDLLLDGALDVFDLLVADGFADGVWRIFLDHRQNVFSAVDVAQLERLTSAAQSQLDLVDNCRNTPEIATTTGMLAAVEPDNLLASEGSEVEVKFVLDRREIWREVMRTIEGWTRRGVEADRIVVLGEGVEPPTALAGKGLLTPVAFSGPSNGHPSWCAIEDFKGLEASAVIVTGIEDLSSTTMRRRVYVGCSRARSLLAVVLDEDLREDFNLRATEFARLHDTSGV